MKHGLLDSVLNKLQAVFRQHSQIETVYLYGSRATNTYKETSDIDLAIKLKASSQKNSFNQIKTALNDLSIIYKLDVIDLNTIKDQALKDDISNHHKIIYSILNEIKK